MNEWLQKILGRRTPNAESSIEEEARYLIEKESMFLHQKIWRSIPYGISVAVYAIIIPYIATKYTSVNIVLIGFIIVALAVFQHLIKSDFQLKARKWWALKTLEVYEDAKELSTKYNSLDEKLRKGAAQLGSLNSALATLSTVLKYNILEKCNSVIINDNTMQIDLSERIITLRDEIKNICKYICEILGGSNNTELRCGIIVENPDKKSKYIPLVVYNPQDEDYVSKQEFTSDDFSGKLISHFLEHSDRKDWKKYAVHIIENVDEFKLQGTHETFHPISLRQHQTYIKSIAGNVIYCRNKKKKIIVLGIINIDSNEMGTITSEKYKALQPYLFPAFRLLAERLLIIKKYPKLFNSIWENE